MAAQLLPFATKREFQCFVYGFCCCLVIIVLIVSFFNNKYDNTGTLISTSSPQHHDIKLVQITTNTDEIKIPMDPFPEPAWRTPQTLATRTLTSTSFARFEIHQVLTDSGTIVDDWLWTDERSHVNILVHLKDENKYLLFHQKKYGLEKPMYAAIGGLFEKGDTPTECANRELLEETGLETNELISLGKYRVQVNRGGGILHAFLAKNSVLSKNKKSSDDYEKQVHRKLTRQELIDVCLNGEVGEAQWLATIALGLLYEEHQDHHVQLVS